MVMNLGTSVSVSTCQGVYLKTLESTAAPELLLEENEWTEVPLSFSPDGHHLLYSMYPPRRASICGCSHSRGSATRFVCSNGR